MVMSNHFYFFDGKIYHQKGGAAIGNQASEKLGKLLMKRFDRKFVALLKKLKVEHELYKRYVDDILAALAGLGPGVRWDGSKMIVRPDKVEEDKSVRADARTFEELEKIAGTIFKCLDFTSDSPSSHEEEKVPVLDLKVYVGKEGFIMHEFYEKPVACKFVIPACSVHSKKTKIAVMVEEGVRRLRNFSQGLDSQRKSVWYSGLGN